MPDPSQPNNPAEDTLKSLREVEAPQPSEAEVVQALVEIEQATKIPQAQTEAVRQGTSPRESWFSRYALVPLYFSLALAVLFVVGWGAQRVVKFLTSVANPPNNAQGTATAARHFDPAQQSAAEKLLEHLATGDSAAADQILSQSAEWAGKTQRTQKTDQLLTTAINLPDMRVREAAIQAQLALEGIPQNETGLEILKQAVGNPRERARVLWLLGALGSRGVDPVHIAKIIESYLDDPDVNVRSGAVNGLVLVATDETIPMLLDRFRNDPSPVVQERAICGLAESGMYTHPQRMVAAATLVGWLDDALLTSQQRLWTFQALHDITGASLGTDPAAWRDWWAQNSRG